ncbi:hypothetical protein MMC07_005905 [Pseudocyphellaria aurata]|nr:hypothetical protein [Pseudocyphellaria aurata]
MNGTGGSAIPYDQNEPADVDAQILRALEVIHDPWSQNLLRQKASQYLEEIKLDKEAPYHGFGLASTKAKPAVVRHFGLSLLDQAIRHRWAEYTLDQRTTLREWVLALSESVTADDPLYLRNKIAEIWVEVAKRSWVLEWMDMDELLVRLWNGSVVQKMLVLTILETLSEDIFGHEDAAAGLRGTDLNRAFVDIFTPATVLTEQFPSRETSINVRYGQEGWISRIGELTDWCTGEAQIDEPQRACAVKCLLTLKSAIGWIIPRALVDTRSVRRICRCLAAANLSVQLAAVDALYTLYNRSRFTEEDFKDLVCPLYGQDIIELLRRLYEWSVVDATNIDEEKYLLSKKFSEMIFNIGRLLEERPSLVAQNNDLGSFFDLLLSIVKNKSLHVSIPALHLWTKLLGSDEIGSSPAVIARIGDLLETCSHRMIRYEGLPENSSDPSIIFLNDDVDTMPERHAFLGNYSRFCNQIVETIVQKQPVDALYHILSQADHVLDHLYDGEPSFQPQTYSKTSVPLLRIDAQFSVIEAALKGCAKWLSTRGSSTDEREHDIMTSNLQDPLIKERVIQLAVGFATGPLKRNATFAFRVFEYTLDTRYPDDPACATYSDAVKDLHGFCLHQLQRLAMRFPDYLITIFDEVERRIDALRQSAVDEQTRVRYSSVLFIITHRATSVDEPPREARLESFLQPQVSQWQRNDLSHSLSSFEGFCELVGLGGIQHYVSVRSLHQVQEWSSHPLDEEGKLLQLHMQTALEAHAFHDPANWAQLRPELTHIVHRILTDRFWQVGISTGSRDEFYAKVGGTKTTLEGFASSVRATLRAVRETGYRILYYMSLLGDQFYGLEELPGPLARALFTDACALSTHQMAIMIEMIRPIIDNCPVAMRSHFLPPILAAMFQQLDRKASAEWDKSEQRNEGAAEGDTLADEMRDESILRQLTFTSVMVVVGLLDPQKTNPLGPITVREASSTEPSKSVPDSIRSFVLNTPEILKPVILFCTHALRMRDTRSCSFITRVLRSLVPEFDGPSPVAVDVREFISEEVLKACITSLHDSYFVDLQKDLAHLIASIVTTYGSKTETPRRILLSLPGMTSEKVDRAMHQLFKAQQNSRQQRAMVLDLLAGLRGVSISEQGKIAKPDTKKLRSTMQEQYMTVDAQSDGRKESSPDLAGIANMFG